MKAEELSQMRLVVYVVCAYKTNIRPDIPQFYKKLNFVTAFKWMHQYRSLKFKKSEIKQARAK